MSILLTPETETKLRDKASREGRDPNGLAESILAAFLDGKITPAGPDIPYVADDDYEALNVLIEEAEANFAAGKFKTLDQIRLAKREQFELALS